MGPWKIVAIIVVCLAAGLLAPPHQADVQESPETRVSQQPPASPTRETPHPQQIRGAAQTPQRPNILFVLTDDQDIGSVAEMPKVRSGLVEKGTMFDRAFVTTALCCPSRASILRGQYAHNHRIWRNIAPEGGFRRFEREGYESSTVTTWLDEAGYHTGYIGKYFKEYGTYEKPSSHVPPGWDRWIGYQGGPGEQKRDGAFKVNDGGEILRIKGQHDTDYFARAAENYIRNRRADRPWFLVVATNAPHLPAEASKRNEGSYAGRTMLKTPGLNEADISDKAAVWRDNRRLADRCPRGYRSERGVQCLREAEELWRDRMESLQDVDDMVGRLLTALSEKGFAENTYVVFMSDNGFSMYRNRIFSKGAPYERSHRVPFIVRGPGVAEGKVDYRLVANIDLAPTFAQWAEAESPAFVDGRSLVPVLSGPDAPWRTRLLFEHRLGAHVYDAVRTDSDQVYIEYPRTGETEYYNLREDPHQLDGAAEKPPPELKKQLEKLRRCVGAKCREADAQKKLK